MTRDFSLQPLFEAIFGYIVLKGGGKIYGVPGPGSEAGGQGLFLGKNVTG